MLKIEQTRWEPVKAMSSAFGAGLAVATGLMARRSRAADTDADSRAVRAL